MVTGVFFVLGRGSKVYREILSSVATTVMVCCGKAKVETLFFGKLVNPVDYSGTYVIPECIKEGHEEQLLFAKGHSDVPVSRLDRQVIGKSVLPSPGD